jgi:hypothetical protein
MFYSCSAFGAVDTLILGSLAAASAGATSLLIPRLGAMADSTCPKLRICYFSGH